MKLIRTLFILISIFSSQLKASAPPQQDIACSYRQQCEDFDTASYKCFDNNEPKECDVFVELFEKLLDLPTAQCRNNKMARLGIIYYCAQRSGGIQADINFDRLSRLPTEKALSLYTSKKFRNQLFDHIRETHLKRSLRDQKNLGKTLFPSNFLPECMTWDEDIVFKETKQDIVIKGEKVKDYKFSIGETKDFILWAGDIEAKIIQKKSQHTCIAKLPGILLPNTVIDINVRKVKDQDILLYETYGANYSWNTLVEMSTCKKIWEREDVNEEEEVPTKITTHQVKNSLWKQCAPCWNEYMQGCFRI